MAKYKLKSGDTKFYLRSGRVRADEEFELSDVQAEAFKDIVVSCSPTKPKKSRSAASKKKR